MIDIPVVYSMQHRLYDSLDDLVRAIDREFPGQVGGSPLHYAQTGEEYEEFSERSLCRPDSFDEQVIKRFALKMMGNKIWGYLSERSGPIYWRFRLEDDWGNAPQVIRYDEAGPDRDSYTDKRCFMDHRWKRYGVYCRLLRSDKPVLDEGR